MADTTLQELWSIKDNIAKAHNYDLDSLVCYLKEKYQSSDKTIIESNLSDNKDKSESLACSTRRNSCGV
jgi:hypothetical protein